MPNIVAPICPSCGGVARYVDSVAVYGVSYGMMWLCPTATCDSYVGAHADGRPKGTLANRPLRNARIAAHAAFDGWWKADHISRTKAYKALALVMHLREAHIGEMDEDQCRRVVGIFAGTRMRHRETPAQFVRRIAETNPTFSQRVALANTETSV